MKTKLSLGIKGKLLLITGEGELRAKSCFALKKVLCSFLENSQKTINIFLDLQECLYMDSTFIGFIIDLAIQTNKNQNTVNIINPSKECNRELERFSCFEMINVIHSYKLPDITTFDIDIDKYIGENIENLETIFISHKTLCDLSNENYRQFSSLLNELKATLRIYHG